MYHGLFPGCIFIECMGAGDFICKAWQLSCSGGKGIVGLVEEIFANIHSRVAPWHRSKTEADPRSVRTYSTYISATDGTHFRTGETDLR